MTQEEAGEQRGFEKDQFSAAHNICGGGESMATQRTRGIRVWMISLIAVGFGLLTIKAGGAILFGDDAARTAAGDYVPFVLWFNFLAGFAYVIAGAELWMQTRWAAWLAISIAAATALIFVAFGAHVYSGGLFEQRTVMAMSLRTFLWTVIAVVAWRGMQHMKTSRPEGGRQ